MKAIKWLLLAVGVALCFAPCAVAQDPQLTLVGVGGQTQGDYYIYPYYIEVSSPGVNYVAPMVCDDFSDEIGMGSTWEANAYTINDLSSLLFASGPAGGGAYAGGLITGTYNAYADAITLAAALMGVGSAPAGYTNGEIQMAIWYIFNPTGVAGNLNGVTMAQIQALIAWAASNQLTLAQLLNWTIWTPGNCVAGSCPGQEFFQYPEGGTALGYLLLAGVSCFGAMFFKRGAHA